MGAKFIPTHQALQTQRENVKKSVFTAEEGGLFSLEQWFSNGRDLATSGDILGRQNWGRREKLLSFLGLAARGDNNYPTMLRAAPQQSV